MSLQRVVVRCSLLCSIFLFGSYSQKANAQAQGLIAARVVEAVNDANRVTLSGNVHPLARAEFDRGAVADAQAMNRMLLLLKRSDGQEASLQAILQSQQDKSSGSFHQWLTPEQFGAQFGPADADIQAVTDWLTRQGFSIGKVYSGKTVIEFSGTAGQVQRAFGTAIHSYQVNGKTYSANASDPQIPAALAPVVAGVVSLHNFPRQFYTRRFGSVRMAEGKSTVTPLVTMPNPFGSGNFYGLGPGDFAKIYGSAGLIQAGKNGSGQTIAIVGETNLAVSDVQQFRSVFNLPATFNANSIVYNGEDPGITSTDEEAEALLDTQWSGAVAPGAAIKFVLSASTSASQGVDLSALYIVEHNLAGVISESYGECELGLGSTGNSFFNNLWEQASAQGITVAISSGDNGSAGCDDPNQEGLATHAPAVNGLGSTPYNVSVGGTDFDEYNNWTPYWSTTNNATTGTSALGYIPEIPWNQSCAQLGAIGCNINTTPYELQNIVAGSGGPSAQYSKPSWQVGTAGMPADNKRDLPDISLLASPGFNGTGYLYCQSDASSACVASGGFSGYMTFGVIGGTSASAPAFAGVMALINQSQATAQNPAPRQGNANYILYALANKAGMSCASSASEAAGCVFNDVVAGSSALPTGGSGKGTNSVPCKGKTLDCSSTVSGGIGVLDDPNNPGKQAWVVGAGYDLVTGLGSVNIGNLAAQWSSVSSVATTTTLTLSPTTGITHGAENVSVTIGVTPSSGTATGTVSLIAKLADGTTFGAGKYTLGSGGSVSGTAQNLPGGANYQVYAHYSGDGTNAPSDSAAVNVTVAQESSKTFIVVPTFDPSSGNQTNGNATSVTYGSSYIVRVYVTNSSGTASTTGAPGGACGQTSKVACPGGTVALTANGVAVDGGTFQLNDIGYTRDLSPTLGAGTYSLSAAYSGDGNFQASTGVSPFTVNLAPTTLNNPYDTGYPLVGQATQVGVSLTSQVYAGLAPTGTVTFFDGGNPIPGTVTFTGTAPGYSGPASAAAFISPTFMNSGIHIITAKYSGDANYAPATSSGSATLDVLYPTTASVSINPTSVNYGTMVTLTAIIDTTVPSSNAALKPTGTVTLYGGSDGMLNSGVTTSAVPDAQGNWEIQLTASFKPSASEGFTLTYNGDTNYASAYASGGFVTVIQPDFTMTPGTNSLTITAGQTGNSALTIAPLTGLSSSVALTCSPAIIGATCSLNPPSVNLANSVSATTMITLSTLGPSGSSTTAALRRKSVLVFVDPGSTFLRLCLSYCAVSGLLCLLILVSGKQSRPFLLRSACMCLFVVMTLGCGGGGGAGGGGSGGGTGGGGGALPTSVAITASTTKVPAGGAPSVLLTATVASGSPATGTITFWEKGNGGALAPDANLVSSSASALVGLAQVGTHQIYASYNGDAGHQTSTSSTINVVATGSAFLQIQGVTGPNTRYATITVTLQ
jgi:hypothetical protein